ncbi:AAA family ATPase [Oceanobacillus salinisoli]|uniref:AAA family ATPase n=1 Tax=Oceanobacillus salinisoli TaxID=2678611 RepID=UPI0012E2CC9F|nr:AAA family ATPase [Oceanobacillus salinisoli]
MKIEEIKTKMLQSNYIDIAFKRYLEFKKTPSYEEKYKFEILSELNVWMQNQEITAESVLEIALKLQKSNPTSGSFVHWSNIDHLVKFAEAEPELVGELWNKLFDFNISLTDRIESFREAGKKFNPKISLGAPLFGYIFAAYDASKYPIYKEEIFKSIKKSYGIDNKLGSVGQNYADYMTICEIALTHLSEEHREINMLDIQDYFYCSTTYNKIIVESGVEFIYEMAKQLYNFKENPALLLETIKHYDRKTLEVIRDIYRNSEKVNLIRFKLIDKIIQGISVTIDDLEEIKEEVNNKYETNILKSWNNFTIMFQLFYHFRKFKVHEELSKIHESIRNFDELSEFEFVEDKVLNGFSWNQNFGGSECWLAVFEKKYGSHRSAPQLFVSISEAGIRYGLGYGFDHAQRGNQSNLTVCEDIDNFIYEDFWEKFVAVSNLLYLNDEIDPFNGQDLFSVNQWNELLQNKDIVKENDLEYLFAMHELGGEATATQLAQRLGKHPSSFNSPVVNLAKRIQNETGVPIPQRRDTGENQYWHLLFNGESIGSNFKWKLKENLKEAVALNYENHEDESARIDPYTKQDFLNEVFMGEDQYNQMVNLLKYKKNIILQGPPGVGKTFVSKQLVFSLMGRKDESRVEIVQFHQSYSYEDFVMGFRPNEDGGFALQYGVFYEFCKRAEENPGEDFYFIIDEINRGNLSKIFGELFMLIERDKREEYVTMGYSKEKFTIPSNVYIIGTMNTADRSLAQIEVALRRRFAFMTPEPLFNQKWERFMMDKRVSQAIISRILNSIEKINNKIRDDFQLGRDYEIGHSFFTTIPDEVDENAWYEAIIEYEIKPLLEEYFFDRPEEVTDLLEGI